MEWAGLGEEGSSLLPEVSDQEKLDYGYLICMWIFHEVNLETLISMSLDSFHICNQVIICPPYLQQLLFILIHVCLIHSSLFSEPVLPLRAPVPKSLSNAVWLKSKPRLQALFTTWNDE